MKPPSNLPISHRSLKDEVRLWLRDQIVTGKIAPGQRIVETELARRLSVSQATIREALRGLEEEGLVRTMKHKGTYATEVIPREIYYTFLLRTQIECSALEITIPKFTEQQANALEEITHRMRAVGDDQSGFELQSKWDVVFHRTLLRWAEVSVYEHVWRTLEHHVRRFITLVHPTFFANNRDLMIQQHENLIRVFQKGDISQSQCAMREHIMLIWTIHGKQWLQKSVLRSEDISPLQDPYYVYSVDPDQNE
jgi:DNA-binding GntR family transcriptional regulator